MITDTELNEIAKSLNNESYKLINYLAVGTTEITSVLSTDTTIAGEIGSRNSLTSSRILNEVSYTGFRNSSNVVNTAEGDIIESIGLFNTNTQSTTDKLLIGVAVNGITQTTTKQQAGYLLYPAALCRENR